jgi:hypothetical protein
MRDPDWGWGKGCILVAFFVVVALFTLLFRLVHDAWVWLTR